MDEVDLCGVEEISSLALENTKDTSCSGNMSGGEDDASDSTHFYLN